VEFDEGHDEGREDDGPLFAFLPPDDRLWRHPSEIGDVPTEPNPTVPPSPARSIATLARPVARTWSVALAAGLVGALIASGVFVGTGMAGRQTTVVEPVMTPATVALEATSGASQSGVANWPSIANALAASVVAVRVSNEGNLQTGSGVLYAAGDNQSYLITAQDLVAGGGSVVVVFTNGEVQDARLVGSDPLTGIALLATAGAHRSFPPFGSVSNVEIAEQVLAVGTRLANSSPVVTGAVSGLDQAVTTGSNDGDTMVGMLALSGATLPQTSDGGALVDPNGEVVGIATDVTSTDPSAQGVAYAVPIDVAEHVATQLLAGQTPTHPWLGIDDATDLTGAAATQLGVTGGAVVGMVDAGSPASAAHLQPDDIVIAFDGHAVTSSGALVTLLSQCQPGERTTLTFLRQAKKLTVTVTVGDQPSNA
jgi:putative serine protease PepD